MIYRSCHPISRAAQRQALSEVEGEGALPSAFSNFMEAVILARGRALVCFLQIYGSCHPERGRAPARFHQRGKPESKDLGFLEKNSSLGRRLSFRQADAGLQLA